MVSKYDLFLYLTDKREQAKPSQILRALNKKSYEYRKICRLLFKLYKEKHISRTKQGYLSNMSKESVLLHKLITYCISNGLNYNELLDKELAKFISQALLKVEFSLNDFRLHPRVFKKYLDILKKSGQVIVISEKPLKAIIIYNSFLGSLLQYFKIKILIRKDKGKNLINSIRREINSYNKYKNNLLKENINDEFEAKFIHSSLSMEGNPITLPETIKILKEKILPKDLRESDVKELQNYEIALKFVVSDSSKGITLSKQRILNYHYLALSHNPDIAGKIRTVNVYIKGNPNFKIAKTSEINSELDSLMKRYESFISKKRKVEEIIKFAAYFHNQFQYIHPFVDGNSRTTRLLIFHIFHYFNIPVFDFPIGILERYIGNTKNYKDRNDDDLERTLRMIVLYNLKAVNEKDRPPRSHKL